MAEPIVIPRRFRGPPQSANGGYACGIVATAVEGPAAEVTLRVPPPLQRDLELTATAGGGAQLRDGETLVAEGRPLVALDLEIPEPVTLDDAEAARRDIRGRCASSAGPTARRATGCG